MSETLNDVVVEAALDAMEKGNIDARLPYHEGDMRLMRAAISAALSHPLTSQWQPISTAPKDGTDVLCVCMEASKGYEKHIGTMAVDAWRERYSGFGQFNGSLWPATHWMPLPAAPKGDAK